MLHTHTSGLEDTSLYSYWFSTGCIVFIGDILIYSTCTQVCTVKDKVLREMRIELGDKEIGLMQASNDTESYYRADHLLKESELVLEATCRACSADGK